MFYKAYFVPLRQGFNLNYSAKFSFMRYKTIIIIKHILIQILLEDRSKWSTSTTPYDDNYPTVQSIIQDNRHPTRPIKINQLNQSTIQDSLSFHSNHQTFKKPFQPHSLFITYLELASRHLTAFPQVSLLQLYHTRLVRISQTVLSWSWSSTQILTRLTPTSLSFFQFFHFFSQLPIPLRLPFRSLLLLVCSSFPSSFNGNTAFARSPLACCPTISRSSALRSIPI